MSVCEDSQYAVRMNRYFLTPIGIWPLELNASFVLRLLQKLSVLSSYVSMNFLLIPCALHAILEEPNLALKVKLVGPMSFQVMAIAKYFCLVNGIAEIEKCFRHVEEDWKFYKYKQAELSIMRSKANVGRFLTFLCASFMYGGGFFYQIIMPLSARWTATSSAPEKLAELDMQNFTFLDYRIPPRAFIYPVYEHWMDVQQSPRYEIIFFAQFFSSYISCTITVGVCSLAAAYVLHVCAQLEIVMRLLRDFAHGSDAGSVYKMKEIVDRHTRALEFALRVERYLNPICCVEFVGCTLNICLLGYYFITEWENRNAISLITYCTLLISITFNIFIFCYIGEILTEQCTKVADMTYEIDWYKLPGKKAVDITLIMIISSCHPARITAGKMVYLSMASFSSVIKTATTYLNLLRTLML